MQRAFCEFEKFLLVKKGISQVTIDGYVRSIRVALKRMGNFIPEHQQIVDYIAWMHKEDYSYAHIVNSSLALEWWTNYHNNPLKLGRPRKPVTIVKNTLTEAEVTRLIAATKNIREKAIVSLLAYSGIRNKELCDLKVGDVDLGHNTVRVLKGIFKKDRLVYITGECSKIIIEYLVGQPRNPDDYMFTTLVKGRRYGEGDLRKLMRVLKARAKINKRIHPHLLRHTLAINLLKRGCGLLSIQKQLGHVFIESTMIYLRSYLQDNMSQYHTYAPSYL